MRFQIRYEIVCHAGRNVKAVSRLKHTGCLTGQPVVKSVHEGARKCGGWNELLGGSASILTSVLFE